ncbi:MAG: BREX-1 system phosphatase PglZ type A [Moraxellaceae bacterium]|nr:BREX-1 system phosphatase PglZ type A [Pseudobdellovibrionaceae bacterium]
MCKIKLALEKLFEQHRIVFWNDVKKELRSEFETLSLDNVQKLVQDNNEFTIKYDVLVRNPDTKFLIYREGERVTEKSNWMLDLELAFAEFKSDQFSIWLGEIGLGFEFASFVQEHVAFFKKQSFRDRLKEILPGFDSNNSLRMKMLAICVNAEDRIDSVLEELLSDLANDKMEKFNSVVKCSLDSFLWKMFEQNYGYKSNNPSVKDFAIELFKSCYFVSIKKETKLNSDAFVLMQKWKDSRKRVTDFEKLSLEFESVLDIEHDLANRTREELQSADHFKIIDKKILTTLINDLANKTISPEHCLKFITLRKQTHWYKENISDMYEAVHHAAYVFKLLSEFNISISSFEDGFVKYTDNWYKLDLNYRKFVYFVRESGQSSPLIPLIDQVENQYTNNFLNRLNNEWQPHVDNLTNWHDGGVSDQKCFFRKTVLPILEKNYKVFVIISDALRFEAGKELYNRILQENRYEGEINFAQSVLPSYTQLGMAALLPNNQISLNAEKVETVFVDGKSTMGTDNRRKIVSETEKYSGTVVLSSDFLGMHLDDVKTLVRDHSFIYLYHDEIDSAGKNPDTLPGAVERTFDTILKMVKKLTSSNANRILITADHGFLFQDKDLDESDFLSDSSIEGELLQIDRRFIIGKDLRATNSSFKVFTAAQAGLIGDVTFAIPKTVNRIRKKGSSIRFVHGGATLQEVVVPVLDIRKKRESDIGYVAVEILGGTSHLITTGQLAVALYQSEPISNKVRPLQLKIGLFCGDVLISDSKVILFDRTAEDPRDREFKLQFLLSQEANKFNNREVELRLFEQTKGTDRYDKLHKVYKYTLRRSFTSDFDF